MERCIRDKICLANESRISRAHESLNKRLPQSAKDSFTKK